MSIIFDVTDIEDRLCVEFRDKALLKMAFTHSSFANEKKISSNENLEFLGDSILNFVVAEHLFNIHRGKQEGELSKMRANVVSAKPLYQVIENLGIGEHMFLGVGEAKNDKNRINIFSDLYESIVAAIYLDSGMEVARGFILRTLKDTFYTNQAPAFVDYKTKLQERIQKMKGSKLKYELVHKKGPDHCPEFIFSVILNDAKIGEGQGKSKKDAQQAAAQAALEYLEA